MLFMVIERFKDRDPIPVYKRVRDVGIKFPKGCTYVGSWIEPNFDRCFQLMECDDARLLQEWILNCQGLGITFEIVPVVPSKETRRSDRRRYRDERTAGTFRLWRVDGNEAVEAIGFVDRNQQRIRRRVFGDKRVPLLRRKHRPGRELAEILPSLTNGGVERRTDRLGVIRTGAPNADHGCCPAHRAVMTRYAFIRTEEATRRKDQPPAIAFSIAASAASALAPSGPPACAMSGRPPPPLPPSASEATRTRSTAL